MIPSLFNAECAICGRRPSVPFTPSLTKRYVVAVLKDDGWEATMLSDGRYVFKCPDCCDAEERDDRGHPRHPLRWGMAQYR